MKAWIKKKLDAIKTHVKILVFALSDSNCPWYAKAFGYLVMIYALSPIDLIPDFIPVLGYLDDLILIPLGIKVFKMLIGKTRWLAYEDSIKQQGFILQKKWYYAFLVIFIWLMIIFIIIKKITLQ